MTLPSLKEPGTKRRLVLLAAVLVGCVALFTWAAYTFLPAAADTYKRQIVNDDYAVLTEPLTVDGEISQRMVVKGRVYGIILNLTTFGRVPHGTLHLRLYADSGEVVAGCDADMSTLLDNTFHRFMFDVTVDGGAGAGYYLSLTATPETEADALAFYRSDGPAADYGEDYLLADFPLFQNDAPVDGTLALQYVTGYVGTSIVRGFALFAAVATLALLTVFALLFLFRAGFAAVFAVAAAALGLSLVMLVPPATQGQAPYIADAYHYANLLLGTADGDGPTTLTVRTDDRDMLENTGMDAFFWQDITEAAAEQPEFLSTTTIPASRAGVAFVLYLPQIIGLVLARVLQLNTFWLLLLPRLFNLATYIALTALALRRAPALRPLLAGAALLPASLQWAGSFSPGGLALAAFFCLAAACADYARDDRKIAPRQIGLLVLCAGAAALYSPAFATLPLLVLIIPARQAPKRFIPAFLCGMVALSALGGVYAASSPSAAAQPVNAQWLKTLLIGTWDGGAVLAALNWLMPLALLGLLAALAIPHTGGPVLLPRTRAVAAFVAGLCIAIALPYAIWGGLPLALDGRYLLPALVLLLAALCAQALRFRRDATRTLLFWSIATGALLQLDAFITVMGG